MQKILRDSKPVSRRVPVYLFTNKYTECSNGAIKLNNAYILLDMKICCMSMRKEC